MVNASPKAMPAIPPFDLSGLRVKRLTPFFSLTSWREGFNSFVFINIVERQKTEISTLFVFNNLQASLVDFRGNFF